jgi:hypothetical protein
VALPCRTWPNLALEYATHVFIEPKIPIYAVFKLWTSVISPMVLGRGSAAPADKPDEAAAAGASKRQEKLRKRQERGDPRVKVQTRK